METLQMCAEKIIEDSNPPHKTYTFDLPKVINTIDSRLLNLNAIIILEQYLKDPATLRASVTQTPYLNGTYFGGNSEMELMFKLCHQKSLHSEELRLMMGILAENQALGLRTLELRDQMSPQQVVLVDSIGITRLILGSKLKKSYAETVKKRVLRTEIREILTHVSYTLNDAVKCAQLCSGIDNLDLLTLSTVFRAECFEISMQKLKLHAMFSRLEHKPRYSKHVLGQLQIQDMESYYVDLLRKEVKISLMKKVNFLKWHHNVHALPKYWKRFRRALRTNVRKA